jgi:hypothetical protein
MDGDDTVVSLNTSYQSSENSSGSDPLLIVHHPTELNECPGFGSGFEG